MLTRSPELFRLRNGVGIFEMHAEKFKNGIIFSFHFDLPVTLRDVQSSFEIQQFILTELQGHIGLMSKDPVPLAHPKLRSLPPSSREKDRYWEFTYYIPPEEKRFSPIDTK